MNCLPQKGQIKLNIELSIDIRDDELISRMNNLILSENERNPVEEEEHVFAGVDTFVYINPKGTRYHLRKLCYKSYKRISERSAIRRKMQKCKVC